MIPGDFLSSISYACTRLPSTSLLLAPFEDNKIYDKHREFKTRGIHRHQAQSRAKPLSLFHGCERRRRMHEELTERKTVMHATCRTRVFSTWAALGLLMRRVAFCQVETEALRLDLVISIDLFPRRLYRPWKLCLTIKLPRLIPHLHLRSISRLKYRKTLS